MSLTDKTVRLWTLTFVSWFNHGRVFNKFKPLKIRIKMIFNEFLLQRKLSFIRVYTEVIYFGGFSGAFPAIFPPFKQVWSLGFLWSSLRHFWSVFLLDFFKWNSTLCQIFWIPDLHLLQLSCFMVANTWEWKYADSLSLSDKITSRWRFLVGTKSGMTTCENTSNTCRVLLMFY